MRYVYIKALAQAEGDLHLSDGTNWNTSKALIFTIRVITSSTDWDLYILQNDNGYAADDANIPMMQIMEAGNGNGNISLQYPYEDEDISQEVHLYYLDNSGANTADIYIIGLALDELNSKIDTIDSNVDAILVDTNSLNDTKIPNTLSLANINAEIDTAFTDYDPPTRTEATADKADVIAEIDANEAKIDTIDGIVDTILLDTDEVQAELADGGRTDLILDELTTQGDTNEAKIDIIDTNVDTLLTHNIGAGAVEWTYTLTEQGTGTPIADADVWVTSDIAGTTVIASGKTNYLGVVTFYLDVGTVYVWRQKTGWDFTNPDTEVVS